MATGHRKADIRALPCAYLPLDGDVLPFKVRLAQASMARARIREFGCRSIDRTGAVASRIESSVQDEVAHHREIVFRIACTVSFPVKQTDQSRTFGDLSAVLGQDHPRRERWPAAHRARRGTRPSAAQRKAHASSDQQDAFNRIGPRKPLRKNVNTLQQGECLPHTPAPTAPACVASGVARGRALRSARGRDVRQAHFLQHRLEAGIIADGVEGWSPDSAYVHPIGMIDGAFE